MLEAAPGRIDEWARKGWVDLRPANLASWQDRFRRMLRGAHCLRGRGSAMVTHDAYLFEDIRIGEVVAWIFNNERDGRRVK